MYQKVYDQTVALDGLNNLIESGKIIGLIGHNGAGKSTTIKSLVSVIHQQAEKLLWMDKNCHPIV